MIAGCTLARACAAQALTEPVSSRPREKQSALQVRQTGGRRGCSVSLQHLFGTILLTSCASLYGQATSGNLIGTVTDPGGAVIPDVKIKITSQDRGTVYNTTSNESGNYSQVHILPGLYTLEFSASGFQRFTVKDVLVGLDRSTRVDAQLVVGQVSEEVSVTAVAPPLVTDRAEVSASLASKQVNELPTLNRNFTALQLLMPGAQKTSWQHATSENPQQGIQINTNGQRFGSNNFMIDGADNNDPVLGIIVVNPAIDSVSEFKYTTGNYDAEYAQAGGAVLQIETKTGTNNYHGSLFEFLQNNITNARNPFSEPNGPPPLRWNQFGGSFGGPIKKNKLFFFGDYQGTRRRTGGSIQTTVPTAAERIGDFSALGVPIFDPMSGNADGSGRSQFPNNQLPANRISPAAKNLVALLPAPNFGPPGAYNNNFISSGSEAFNSDQFDIRADHTVKDNFRYFSRYSYAKFDKNSPAAFGPSAGGPSFPTINFAGISDVRNQNLVGGFNDVLNPTLLTDFRFGYVRYRVNVQSLDYGKNSGEAAGIPNVNFSGRPDTSGLPEFRIDGNGGFREGFGLDIGQCNCPLYEREWVLQFVNTWTKVKGNHTIKWGADVRRAQNIRVPSDQTRNGEFIFSPVVTGSADVSGSGLGPAAFMLGMPSGFSRFWQTVTEFPEDFQWRMFYFVQDTWRVTAKLTLSYGLRWDTWFPNQSTLKGGGSRYNVVTNNFEIVGYGDNDQGANVRTQWHNFSPRFALAYALDKNTVIRTGWGRSYYEEIFGANFNNIAYNYPTVITQSLPQVNSFTPLFQLSNGPPTPAVPQIPSNGLLPLPPDVGASYIPQNLKYPNVDSWNFTLERLLVGDLTATVSYVGNVGRHEQFGVPLNQAVPGPGPFNPRRPLFQKFGISQGVNDASNAASNSYNGLQTKLTKRFSHGLSLLAGYTLSKTLNYPGGVGPAIGNRVTRGPADWDRKHVLSIGHTYELPFGRGRPYLHGMPRAGEYILGGWQFAGITQYQTGWPFSPGLNNNASINADVSTPPDFVMGADPYNVPGGQNRDHWFNPAAYAIPAPYKYGNAGRNSLRGPSLFTADWSLSKRFNVTEKTLLEFRWETFNTFNHTNLANPNGAIDAGVGSAAVITSISNPMRQMQFGLRLDF